MLTKLILYILISKEKEYYCETNCNKETFSAIIKQYKKSVKTASIKGLYKYLRQQGYRVVELNFIEKEDYKDIFEF